MNELNTFINSWTNAFKGFILAAAITKSIWELNKAHSEEKSLKEVLAKVKKYFIVCVIAMTLPDLVPLIKASYMIYSNTTADNNNLIGGGKYLATAVGNVLIGLESVIVIYNFIKNLVGYKAATDEEKPSYKQAAIKSVIIGILVITITGLFQIIFSYYK